MHVTHILRSAALAAVVAASLAHGAFAGGETKNQLPFTRPVSQPAATVVIRAGGGFSWTDGAIGMVAGLGVALSGAAGLTLVRRSPRTA